MRWLILRRPDQGAALLVAIFQFAFNEMLSEVNEWAFQLAALVSDRHPLAPEVCGAAAMAAWSSGDTDAAITLGLRAVDCSAELGGGSTIWARTALQNALGYAGRISEVGPHYMALVDECRRSEDPYWNVLGVGFEAVSLMMVGRLDRARDRIDKALALARRVGNPDCLHWALYCLGRALAPADPEAASAAFQEAMDAVRSVDSRLYLTLDVLEWVAVRRRLGDVPSAVVGLLELQELLHSSGNASQLSQMYAEVAQVLVEMGEVSAASIVFLARSGLPQLPKGIHEAESEADLLKRLRRLGDRDWRVLEVRAVAMTNETLMTFARDQLERARQSLAT
jgi:tetratricopeptide (TPR) repeat protein